MGSDSAVKRGLTYLVIMLDSFVMKNITRPLGGTAASVPST